MAQVPSKDWLLSATAGVSTGAVVSAAAEQEPWHAGQITTKTYASCNNVREGQVRLSSRRRGAEAIGMAGESAQAGCRALTVVGVRLEGIEDSLVGVVRDEGAAVATHDAVECHLETLGRLAVVGLPRFLGAVAVGEVEVAHVPPAAHDARGHVVVAGLLVLIVLNVVTSAFVTHRQVAVVRAAHLSSRREGDQTVSIRCALLCPGGCVGAANESSLTGNCPDITATAPRVR
eukprot:1176237-Prorocentrum_minimum.AAC.3